MNDSILQQILAHKVIEVARQRSKVTDDAIQKKALLAPPVRSFAQALRRHRRPTLIAEVKHASPSRGILIEPFLPLVIAATYSSGGASAISVLTDQRYFQGSLKYLEGIRQQNAVGPDGHHPPLLRKDFIIDTYQVFEARAYGADAILLIMAALADDEIRVLYDLAQQLGMDVLVEVHDDDELQRALALNVAIIGVNNRNLHTFELSLATTAHVFANIPAGRDITLVSESGIFTAADVVTVARHGANAILVGEALIKSANMLAKTQELAGNAS
ncbi:MAG: indole-3-glycerol phosphate synthase TrpC [Chloroflexales bacterium]|nr:indole-3-glycerol phosphate synthase TrpC [Chloroflexales bacterium]